MNHDKLSFAIPIQILVANDISQYPKNQLSWHESTQQALSKESKR